MINDNCNVCSGHEQQIKANETALQQVKTDQREKNKESTDKTSLLFRKHDLLQTDYSAFKIKSIEDDYKIEARMATYVTKWVFIATFIAKVLEVGIMYLIEKL